MCQLFEVWLHNVLIVSNLAVDWTSNVQCPLWRRAEGGGEGSLYCCSHCTWPCVCVLSVTVLSVTVLSVTVLSVTVLSVTVLSVTVLSVTVLSVTVLSVTVLL